MLSTILQAGCASFILSWLMTRGLIWLSPRIGFVDRPGHRKIHDDPKPLGGGIAITLSMLLVLAGGAAAFAFTHSAVFQPINLSNAEALQGGLRQQMPLLIGTIIGTLLMHVTGLIDDRRPLGPYLKLGLQLLAAGGLIIFMELLAARTPSLRLRVLTGLDTFHLGKVASIVISILWVVTVTNAFNFLDNMDGLSAGVASIACTAFLIATISIEQWFVAGALAVLLGSVLGFLCWNFPPARIFMGDSGSLVIGFVIGVLTIRTTFLPHGMALGGGWYVLLAPLIVLAVPLYDLMVVSALRLRRGKSPFTGDTNHFSHRLVARGMSRRTAVLCIYLVTCATSIAAVLLTQVTTPFGAILIFLQTLLILGVVALLEQHRVK